MVEVARTRKERSDKKKDIKPTVPVTLKEAIHRISYITNKPVKDVAEEICLLGFETRSIIEKLTKYLRRDFKYRNTIFIGNIERKSLQRTRIIGPSDRITIRFKQTDYDNICVLAYALDVTPSKATAILLEKSVKCSNIVNKYIKSYLKEQLDPARMRELKKIIKYINQNNPDEEFSWSEFLSFIVDEIKTESSNITNTLKNWLDKHK